MSEEEKLKAAIERLRAIWQRAFTARHGKTDFYEYLVEVLNLYAEWKRAKKRQKYKRILADLYEIKIRKNTHTIRAIIDASAKEEDLQVKSKWTRALQYAAKRAEEVEERGLLKFLQANGGVEGCAAKNAQQQKRAD